MVQSWNLFADQLRIKVVTLLELVYSQCTLATGNHFQLPVYEIQMSNTIPVFT